MIGYYIAGGWLLFVAAVMCFFAGASRLERRGGARPLPGALGDSGWAELDAADAAREERA